MLSVGCRNEKVRLHVVADGKRIPILRVPCRALVLKLRLNGRIQFFLFCLDLRVELNFLCM